MIDRATHWFYAERQVSVGAAVENMRHDFWANGFYNVWLSVSRREAPYLLRGLYNQQPFEVEFEPRKSLIIRSAKDNEWLRTAFTRTLGLLPSFKYQDTTGRFVIEWRMADREARWQAMQGVPTFKNLRRLYAVAEG